MRKIFFNFNTKFMFWLRLCQYLNTKFLKGFGTYYLTLFFFRHLSYKTGMIGAGTVVVKNIPDNSVVVGNPGRVINANGKEMVSLYLN